MLFGRLTFLYTCLFLATAVVSCEVPNDNKPQFMHYSTKKEK